MKIDSARALVTGGSSGIGFATAKLLAARGARVAICGRDEAKLTKAAKEIGAVAIHADVSVESEAVRLVADVVRAFGDYNVLVNNAGFGSFGPLLELDLGEMQRVFATNVFGAMVVARESARHFAGRSYGNIVNVASSAARDDRVLARRAAQIERARDASQPERSADRVLHRPRLQPAQARRHRHRPGHRGHAGDGGPRLRYRDVGLGDESVAPAG